MARINLLLAVLMVLGSLGCAEEYRGKPPVTGELHFPQGMAVDPESGLLFVVNTNFNLAYEMASVLTVDIETGEFRAPYVTLESFPGDLVLTPVNGGDQRYGYVPVRADNSLTWFSEKAAGGSVLLDCNDLNSASAPRCDGRHVITTGLLPQDDSDDLGKVSLGTDPYGIARIPGAAGQKDLLVVSAMGSGRVSLFELQDDGEPVLVSQKNLLDGIHSIAAAPFGDLIYVTNKNYPVVHRLRVVRTSTSVDLEVVDAATLPSPFSSGDFGRGLAFAQGGQEVLIAHRTPATLIALDGSAAAGYFTGTPIAMVPLEGRPSHVMSIPSGPEGQELAYVTCFDDDQIWVVDTQTLLPFGEIPVGAGPYVMASILTESLKKGFVSNFLDDSVSVIDLDPESATYHQAIAEIH